MRSNRRCRLAQCIDPRAVWTDHFRFVGAAGEDNAVRLAYERCGFFQEPRLADARFARDPEHIAAVASHRGADGHGYSRVLDRAADERCGACWLRPDEGRYPRVSLGSAAGSKRRSRALESVHNLSRFRNW